MDTIPAIEDTSPVQLPSPAGEHGEGIRMSIRDQLESARMAQQMYHQSEIQKFEGVIQTLVSEMKEMQQEDEGSEIRIQELERQRDTACLAMQHMNSVNQGMKNDFELAVARINEQSQAQRHQDYIVTEEAIVLDMCYAHLVRRGFGVLELASLRLEESEDIGYQVLVRRGFGVLELASLRLEESEDIGYQVAEELNLQYEQYIGDSVYLWLQEAKEGARIASPEETASSSSWARQKERGDPTPSEAFGSAMPLSKAKNFRGNPDTVQGYAQRMEQGEPAGGKDSKGYVDPSVAHPLDHRLGAGYQNERAWANMAEDGRLQAARRAVQPDNSQVNLDRSVEELLDRDDVVLEVQAPPPAASQAKGRPWGPDGAMVDQSWHSIKIWRYGPWAATWKMTPRIGSTDR
eukprot:s1536_g1.t5